MSEAGRIHYGSGKCTVILCNFINCTLFIKYGPITYDIFVNLQIILINMIITVILFEAFGFPVFVARSNLPAICLLIFLYG